MSWVHAGIDHGNRYSRTADAERGVGGIVANQVSGRLRNIPVPYRRAVVRNRCLVGQVRGWRTGIGRLCVDGLVNLDAHKSEKSNFQPQQSGDRIQQRRKRHHKKLPLRIAQILRDLASQQHANQIEPGEAQRVAHDQASFRLRCRRGQQGEHR
jgi:hypothetical protein